MKKLFLKIRKYDMFSSHAASVPTNGGHGVGPIFRDAAASKFRNLVAIASLLANKKNNI
jgi:hypothetical protein